MFAFHYLDESEEADQLVFRDIDGTQRAMRPFWYPLGLDDPSTMHVILCMYDGRDFKYSRN